MNLEKTDIIKFYELHNRFNPLNNNIGIVGPVNRFDNYIARLKLLYQDKKYIRVVLSLNDKKLRIINTKTDEEVCYIHIQNTNDLTGYYFRKFI